MPSWLQSVEGGVSAHALVTGTLHRVPVMRTAKTGKAFVTALLRSESQGETFVPAAQGPARLSRSKAA